jgi:hypothetical protein
MPTHRLYVPATIPRAPRAVVMAQRGSLVLAGVSNNRTPTPAEPSPTTRFATKAIIPSAFVPGNRESDIRGFLWLTFKMSHSAQRAELALAAG